jgi:glycosyltransferase involved in cell wall biosynthesis
MRILIASTFIPFIEGGGRMIVENLKDELRARGFDTDTVYLPFHSAWTEVLDQTVALRLLDLSESCGDRIDRLITIRTPAHALRHPNKVAWFIHHQREVYDLWDTEYRGVPDDAFGQHFRAMVHRADDRYLRECRKVFTNSRVVADRLRRYNALDADDVLYPPLPRNHPFHPGPFGDYFFYPSRITKIKRQALAVEALKFTPPGVRLVIAGAPDTPRFLRELTELINREGLSDRVELLGWVSEERKAELMAGCCGALYLAYDEDSYGYVTLEAFHSAKPVLTLTDSGGSLEVVEDGYNGCVTPPRPEALGEAMARLWRDRHEAARLGQNAHRALGRYGIDWDRVVEGLTA